MKIQALRKNFPQLRSISLGCLGQFTSRLSIGSKIICGYSLALSIAVVGNVAGLMVGNNWENQARREAKEWHQTGIILGKLQVSVLQTRSHQQQLIALMDKKESYQVEYDHFKKHISEVESLWIKIKYLPPNKEFDKLKSFVKKYEGTTEEYFQQMQAIAQEIDATNLKPAQVIEAQKLLLNFSNSKIAIEFDSLSDDLSKIVKDAFKRGEKAEAAEERGEIMQVSLPVISIVLSATIAVIVSIYISRAIARPLKAATEVARKVTEDANFDLQVPVITEDEAGVLATSLNQLILKVKELLEEQKAANERQQKMQETQLLQNEKMSSLGKLLAGVAHEINNPVNFIYGNINHAQEYVKDILEFLKIYKDAIPQPPKIVQIKAEEIELEFLEEDLPKVLESMKIGADRVRQIVLSLKDFSRLDETASQCVNLHACIDSTLLILQNRLKKGIKVICNYGDIPEIEGYTGFLYQVFMNLLSNAIDALEGASENQPSTKQKQIVITTERKDKNSIMVKIADNGPGIPLEIQPKIFDTFFTTKPRGIGTGLGLAISRQIIEEKHQGRIICTSQIGSGTEFAIALPIKQGIDTVKQGNRGAEEN